MPATLAARNTDTILVMYRGTRLRVEESFSVGAVAVLKNKADILNRKGEMVFPGKVVICKRIDGLAPEDYRIAGTPVTYLDPGEHHQVLILPKVKASPINPIRTIQKKSVRPVEECKDVRPCCKNCCNFPRKRAA